MCRHIITEKRIALDSNAGSPAAADDKCENCGKQQDAKARLQKKKFCSAQCAKTAKTAPAENSSGDSSIAGQPQPATAQATPIGVSSDPPALVKPSEKSAAVETTAGGDAQKARTAAAAAVGVVVVAVENVSGNTATVKPNQEPAAAAAAAAAAACAAAADATQMMTSNKGGTETAGSNNVATVAGVAVSPAAAAVAGPLAGAATAAPATPAAAQGPQLHDWSVTEVCDFIRNLPGCSLYAEEFENQEIDGQALLLLTPNDLVGVGIKLGPALKIIDRVNFMRGATQDD